MCIYDKGRLLKARLLCTESASDMAETTAVSLSVPGLEPVEACVPCCCSCWRGRLVCCSQCSTRCSGSGSACRRGIRRCTTSTVVPERRRDTGKEKAWSARRNQLPCYLTSKTTHVSSSLSQGNSGFSRRALTRLCAAQSHKLAAILLLVCGGICLRSCWK